jgi:hypothetical protein
MRRGERWGRRAKWPPAGWLSNIRWPSAERLAGGWREAAYAEEEVRERIYGWHSGTVEPPEPADSARLAAVRMPAAWQPGQAPAAVRDTPAVRDAAAVRDAPAEHDTPEAAVWEDERR